MSLKAFHVVFIAASILLAFWFAGWSLVNFSDGGRTADLISGLFWHFVDLVWIFLFPVIYLL